jgi:hypothetical protein
VGHGRECGDTAKLSRWLSAVLKGEIYPKSQPFRRHQAERQIQVSSQAATGRHACSDFATTLLLQAASMKSGKLLKSDPEEPGRR